MDFDLNVQARQVFETTLENEFFQWNVDYDQRSDGEQERGSPSGLPSNVGNSEPDLQERGNSDGGVDSRIHNIDEIVESTDDEDIVAGDIGSMTLWFEKRLAPGSILDTLDQVYLLYVEYGRHLGFSVKKGGQRYRYKTTVVNKKEYHCSCEGTSTSKQMTDRLHQYRKQDSRCMCPAMLRVVLDKEGKWRVSKLVKDHNHELADQEHSYMLRSCRNLSHAKKSLIEALHSSGIPIKHAFRFMENEAGGPGNAGFIRKDVYHHMENVRRKTKFNDADSHLLVKHFMEKTNTEQLFYWNMQTDDEGRVMNFFFRDSRSALDYEFFGDVISFDTTYKTNKYELICAPFVGVNHHMKNCLFGLAFLSDETAATFEWLFSCFLESMGGKEPEVIFTDQCQAMMNAIDFKFKSSTHRLCQWHVNQNAPSYFGTLNGNRQFKEKWYHCMNGCESVDEFESTWSRMVEAYGLDTIRWFGNMYNLRRRWSSAFSRDKFCAGLHATSRSEGTNNALKDISSSSGSLHEFVLKYEQLQLEWRRIEGQDDIISLGVPGLLVQQNPLLKHAATFFTRKVFLSYEFEATHSLNVDILRENRHEAGANMLEYEVIDEQRAPKRVRRVRYNTVTKEISCSCCLWQSVGVLCAHIFKIYYHNNVKTIPTTYLVRRLSRDAKRRRASEVLSRGESSSIENNCGDDRAFKNHVMRSTYDMVHDIKMDEEMRAHLLNKIDEVKDELLAMAKRPTHERRRKAQNNF